jgi:hypothetical protein
MLTNGLILVWLVLNAKTKGLFLNLHWLEGAKGLYISDLKYYDYYCSLISTF